MNKETTCNPHPDAPHGFCRNASHNEGRHVCECESWKAPTERELFEEWLKKTDPRQVHLDCYDDQNYKWNAWQAGRAPLLTELDKWKRGFETYESAYKEMYDENTELKKRIEELEKKLNYFRSTEI